jgi:hypothetical protein
MISGIVRLFIGWKDSGFNYILKYDFDNRLEAVLDEPQFQFSVAVGCSSLKILFLPMMK